MTTEIAPIHTAIWQLVKTAMEDARGVAYLGKIPYGDDVPTVKNAIGAAVVKPHAVLLMGDDSDHPRGKHITGARDSLTILPFAVLYAGNDDLQTTQVADVVKGALIGVSPAPGTGQIQRGGPGNVYSPAASALQPQRYFRTGEFWLDVGAITASD